jgi:hypothetical protein
MAEVPCEFCEREKPWEKNGVWLHTGGVVCRARQSESVPEHMIRLSVHQLEAIAECRNAHSGGRTDADEMVVVEMAGISNVVARFRIGQVGGDQWSETVEVRISRDGVIQNQERRPVVSMVGGSDAKP